MPTPVSTEDRSTLTETWPLAEMLPETRSKALFSPILLFLIETKPMRELSLNVQSACAGAITPRALSRITSFGNIDLAIDTFSIRQI